VRADGNVEIRRVVDHTDVGRKRRVGAVLRLALLEVVDGRHAVPHGFVEIAVELDRGGCRNRGGDDRGDASVVRVRRGGEETEERDF
jgi:hypothetical protein